MYHSCYSLHGQSRNRFPIPQASKHHALFSALHDAQSLDRGGNVKRNSSSYPAIMGEGRGLSAKLSLAPAAGRYSFGISSRNNRHASTNPPLDAIVGPAAAFDLRETARVDWLPVCRLMAGRGASVLILYYVKHTDQQDHRCWHSGGVRRFELATSIAEIF